MCMKSRNIHNVRLYNANPTSFVDLSQKYFFPYIYINGGKYRNVLIEFLVNVVKDLDKADKYTREVFEDLTTESFILAEISQDVELPEFMINDILNNLYQVYSTKEFYHFRGNVLELLLVFLEKNKDNKIYHEPRFYHRRKRLFRDFPGSNCLIDVVSLTKRKDVLQLIECKASLNQHINQVNVEGSSFNKKISFMEAVESEISSYKNKDNVNVSVIKALASIIPPFRRLPDEYQDYEYINLFDRFKLRASS